MCDMGLADTVHGGSHDPSAELAEEAVTTHKRSVKGGESATGEGEGRGLIVREHGVGVLEEGDEDEPVVDPEVGMDVDGEDGEEAPGVDGVSESRRPDENADVGDEHVGELVRSEQRGKRGEVCRMYR